MVKIWYGDKTLGVPQNQIEGKENFIKLLLFAGTIMSYCEPHMFAIFEAGYFSTHIEYINL